MKKVNGIATMLAFLLCIDHFVRMGLLMLGKVSWHPAFMISGVLIMVYLLLHGAYSLKTVIGDVRSNKIKGGRDCARINKEYYAQAITGGATLLFAIMHVATIGSYIQKPNIPGNVAMIAFTVLACVHLTIGFPKAISALGLTKKQQEYKVYRLICGAVCLIPAIFTIYCCIAYGTSGGAAL